MISTRNRGILQLCFLTALTIWWSIWILFLPLLDPEHFLHQLFPPCLYGLLIPATVLVVGIPFLMIVAAVTMITGENPYWRFISAIRGEGYRHALPAIVIVGAEVKKE